MKALQAIFELLQSHYPERLSALWFLNAPFIFWGVWRLVTSQPPAYAWAGSLNCSSAVVGQEFCRGELGVRASQCVWALCRCGRSSARMRRGTR